jgi:hypothetical protein
MKKARDMTADEVMAAIRGHSPLARAHAILSDGIGRIEQADMQRKSLAPIERRRMELEIAQEIMSLFVAVS